tara:strand:- start:2821 stop:4476 length:1656 start_codon:yes stop_codon:yes gene_type:complete
MADIIERSKKKSYPKGRQVKPASLDLVQDLLGERARDRQHLIENLHVLQDQLGHLSRDILTALAAEMKLSQSEVYEVATFYHHFEVADYAAGEVPEYTIRICNSIACELAGANELIEKVKYNFAEAVRITTVPCVGNCQNAPVAVYGKRQIDAADPKKIGVALEKDQSTPLLPNYQTLEKYQAENDGYEILKSCLEGSKKRSAIIGEIDQAGLRGMGGAGFPVARKWQFLENAEKPRVLVVNADEGEPGTFKDRYCFETSPHKILEGMLIAAWTIEAEEIYIYLRDEYPQIHELLTIEIDKLELAGISSFANIYLRRGAGAYICGEESALLESIEGKRGLPRNRPPFPAQQGLFQRPTLINNVETLYWVREILANGAEWYQSSGSPRFYSVSGRVNNPGVVQAPSGTTARQLIEDHCSGMLEGHSLKAFLPGGASGGILPAALADEPLDFGSLDDHGCFVGSAAIVVFSDQDNIRDIALNLLRFFEDESCGQCTPCRLGCEKMIGLMAPEKWNEELINDLSSVMRDASICGLGQAAPNPVISALRFFGEEL